MNSFVDAKSIAKTLRAVMAERKISLSHSECLEVIAKLFGLADWNTLSARIDAAAAKPLKLPKGWISCGSADLEQYRLGVDRANTGALIECRYRRDSGVFMPEDKFACMMQSISAGEYRGKKLRLTGTIKTDDVDLATIWMRVNNCAAILRFDNMMDRFPDGKLRGTHGWTERVVILDVPNEATDIHYGFLMRGYGRLWAKEFQLDVVDDSTPVTQILHGRRSDILQKPNNLAFNE
ncbi:glyoxalase superfamily protein [Ensifer sp. NPDC090286]|uniref:glyoxalase superfamily protein n=1 Tax=Ensifer sp. NPDC090286 TaxID=3363991 RepID=UPI00383AAD84